MDIFKVVHDSKLAKELQDFLKKDGSDDMLDAVCAYAQFVGKPLAIKTSVNSDVEKQIQLFLKEFKDVNLPGSAKKTVIDGLKDIDDEIKDDLEKKKPKAKSDYEKRKKALFEPLVVKGLGVIKQDAFNRFELYIDEQEQKASREKVIGTLDPKEAQARMSGMAAADDSLGKLGKVSSPVFAMRQKVGSLKKLVEGDVGPDNILQPLAKALEAAYSALGEVDIKCNNSRAALEKLKAALK